MLTGPDGEPMTPVFTTRSAKRHHYYISRIAPGAVSKSAVRIPAAEIDRAVINAVAQATRDHAATSECVATIDAAERNAAALASLSVPKQREQLLALSVSVSLTSSALEVRMGAGEPQLLPVRLARRGNERRVILPGSKTSAEPDPALVRMVALAQATRTAVLSGKPDPLVDHFSPRHRARMLKIAFLCPDILTAIVEGRQPTDLTTQRFLRSDDLPLTWAAQRQALGL
jgi:hypothetical protein